MEYNLLNQLIQKVVFHDKQNIEVYFRFADEYEKLCSFANTIQEQTTSQFAAAT